MLTHLRIWWTKAVRAKKKKISSEDYTLEIQISNKRSWPASFSRNIWGKQRNPEDFLKFIEGISLALILVYKYFWVVQKEWSKEKI